MRKALTVAAAAAAVALVAAAALTFTVVVRPYPTHDGEAPLPALDADVDVRRDADGTPYLLAGSAADLFRAQGYVHAQDRFWQMDVNRHIATGRTAELLGDAGLEADRFLRTLGWEQIAAAEHAALPDDAREMVDAYAEGVNAYLDERAPDRLGLPYRLLDPVGPGRPEPWDPVHSVAFLKVMAWDLRSNLAHEIERAVLASHLPPERIADLFPPYPDDGPVVVPDFDPGDVAGRGPAHAAVRHPDVAQGARRLGERVAAVEALTGVGGPGLGSNAWVVAGEHTASGAPLLANDPHQSVQMPSIWYENHLRCRETATDCPYDVAGVSLPGVPGVIIGHTDQIAWGLTNLGADVTDLYIERVDPDDPHRYAVEGEWADMDVRTETLRSADGTVEELEVRRTRNGPIVSAVYGPLDGVEPAEQPTAEPDEAAGAAVYELSLRWTALEPGPTFSALPAINTAADFSAFREAARRFAVPAQNLVYADTAGTIGYQVPGWLPVRRHHDGAYPAPGWDDDHQWDGYVPFEDLPYDENPDRGWIATANNPPAPTDAYDFPLTVDWGRGHRKRRIVDLLEARLGDYDVEAALDHQLDTFDAAGATVVPYALAADDGGDERVAAVQALLADWDLMAAADSAGAAAFMATWRHLLAATFHPELPEPAWPERHDRYVDVVDALLERPDDDWWDNPDTTGREERDDVLRAAMARAHDELVERLGDDPDGWSWGELHQLRYREGTLGESGIALVEALVNRDAGGVGGGFGIVNATGWSAVAGYDAITKPSVRTVVDLADLDRTSRLHAPGQSGHPFHRHYTDLADRYVAGTARVRPFTEDAIEQATDRRLRLRADAAAGQ